jgi:hypothetical protein
MVPTPTDFAAINYVLGQSSEYGFLTKVKSQRFHPADETALLVRGLG